MINSERPPVNALRVSAIIALIGVTGEALILRELLINSYPWKMMMYPPDKFYEAVGNSTCPFVIVLGTWSIWRLYRRGSLLSPLWVTALAPLIFSISLMAATGLLYGWRVPIGQHNFDGTTVLAANYEFLAVAFQLSIFGILIGGVCSGLIRLVLKLYHRPKERS